ncbi:Rrf2 family transcriptional regulator [Lunatimonas lonarensis]|uniref:Rrf2 family transcriptional regulator n=1 Tax=Lunatimonas lonarensis TaxID=1232681 RepID=R7ZP29_9BACT|nr:Rrf2 family transcriptional regulator [Lunatimonas lonarensis]EON75779.1 Rrf2 family transcriptional regulator [Lunatimonas lonarensis]
MFSKACQYGIRSVIYIWKQSLSGLRVGAKEIAEHVQAPEPFTAKILQDLVRKNIVSSQKGPSGGFYVEEEQGKFSLKDLVVAIDGDELFTGCSLGLKYCSESNPCPMHSDIVRIRVQLEEMLTRKTLKEIAQEVENGDSVLARFA